MTTNGVLAIYCVLIVLASLAGGFVPLFVKLTHRRMQLAISFVAGLMLGIAVLHMLPHALMTIPAMSAARWLILVAPTTATGEPDLGAALAFIAGPEDAICIGRDVWHAGLTVLDRPAQFGMIMWKAESAEDGILHQLAEPLTVEI